MSVIEVPEATSYQLILRDLSGGKMVIDITPGDFVNGEFSYTFENLDPETDYEIDLRYTNAAGETQETEPVIARTTGMFVSMFFICFVFCIGCYITPIKVLDC